MSSINRDPVLGIRKAVANAMMSRGMQPSQECKDLIDAVVDHLPDFFKQPLQAAEPTDEDRGLKSFGESMANYQSENLRQ
jgi:hypothetical protein